jgi:hypothetical protein
MPKSIHILIHIKRRTYQRLKYKLRELKWCYICGKIGSKSREERKEYKSKLHDPVAWGRGDPQPKSTFLSFFSMSYIAATADVDTRWRCIQNCKSCNGKGLKIHALKFTLGSLYNMGKWKGVTRPRMWFKYLCWFWWGKLNVELIHFVDLRTKHRDA